MINYGNHCSSTIYHRLCFFTTSDAKSTRKFVKVLNESLESGSVMCQLQDAELDKHVMNITTRFCREQHAKPKSEYVKKAAECLGKQPKSSVWVMNEKIHIVEEAQLIPWHQQEYIWLGSMIGSRELTNVALSTDAAHVTDEDPYTAAHSTLSAMKKAVNNNFVAAFAVLGSFCMGIHYEKVLDGYGMCPTPVVIGKKNTGKSTVALEFHNSS